MQLGEFSSFTFVQTDPFEWNPSHVQKWLLWTEQLYRLPHAGKVFQDLTGKDLSAMSEEEFHHRSPHSGDTLHAHLDIWKSGKSQHHCLELSFSHNIHFT